jgi:hypothetical protein
MNMRGCLLAAALSLLGASALFAQTGNADTADAQGSGLSEEGQIVRDVQARYAKAEYEHCHEIISDALERADAGTLHFPTYYLAEIRVYQALLAYAFREPGFEKDVEDFLQQAIELNINYDFTDYGVIPTYVLEQFLKIKREYLSRFSKTSRRNSLGIYVMTSYLSTFVTSPEFINLGLHYAFNLSDNVSLFLDGEFPLSEQIFNLLQFRVGAIWFPTYKVETVSLGLGLLYSLKIENWTAFINVVSFEGYGEFVFRFGLGVGASVELLRMDILMGEGTFPDVVGSVPLFSSDYARFTFANLRFYIFWNF